MTALLTPPSELVTLVVERYPDVGPTLAAEKLAQLHGLTVSRETLGKWMITSRLWTSRRDRVAPAHQPRPRVRSRSGREEVLLTLAHLRGTDRLPERVVNEILVGVSTRGYDASLEAPPPGVRSRGSSRSAVSRHLVARTSRSLRDQLARRLDDVRLAVLMLDGLNVGEQTVVVALGVTPKGREDPARPMGRFDGERARLHRPTPEHHRAGPQG